MAAGLVDFEIQPFGDTNNEFSSAECKPAAAEIEGDIRRSLDGVRASADPLARFQHDDWKRLECSSARAAPRPRAGTDDGDIDFGGRGIE